MLSMLEMGQGVMTAMPMLARRGARRRLEQRHHRVGAAPTRATATPASAARRPRPAATARAACGRSCARRAPPPARCSCRRRRKDWGVAESRVHHRQGRGDPPGQRPPRHLRRRSWTRRRRCRSRRTSPLKDPKAFTLLGKDVPRLDIPGKVNGTRGVRRRRQAARPAGGARRALPRLRRQGRQLQRRQGEGRAGRQARGADRAAASPWWPTATGRRRTACKALQVTWDEGPLATLDLGRHHEAVRGAGAEAGRVGAQRRRLRRGVRQGRQDDRARVRGALPGPRLHGADELHRPRHRRSLRRLRADAVADGDAAGGDGGVGPAAEQGVRAPDVHGRRLRPARRGRLRRSTPWRRRRRSARR